MKGLLVVSFLVLGLLSVVPGSAFAQAQDEASPPPQSTKMSGWDDGFWVRSPDDQFKLKIGGRVQFQEAMEARQGLAKVRSTTNPTVFTPPDKFNDTFFVRRANLETSGTIFEKIDWSTVLNTRSGAPGAATQQINFFADFTVNILPTFRIVGGTVSLPLDMLGEDSSKWYLGVEPPLVATQEDGIANLTIARQSFGTSPDLGIRVEGDVGSRVSYALGATNGSGFRAQNANDKLSYGGRVQVNILDAIGGKQTDFEWSQSPKLSLSAGSAWEDGENAPDTFVPAIIHKWAWTSSTGGAFRYHGLSLNSEFYIRYSRILGVTSQDTNGDGKLRDFGYYADAGYYLIPHKLEAMLTASQIRREGPDNDANEFGGGVNWYLYGNHSKLQFDYTNVLDYDAVPGLNNATYQRFRLMFSVIL